MQYRSIAARLSFGAFVVALAIALVASFGTRLGLWVYTTGFEILLPAVVIGLIAVIAGAWWLTAALRNNNSEGWRWGFAGLIGSLILVWIPLNEARRAYEAPPIHDISTDVEFAPPFEALLPLRKGSPNGPEYDGPKKVMLEGKITTVAEAAEEGLSRHQAACRPRRSALPAERGDAAELLVLARLRTRQAHGLEHRGLRLPGAAASRRPTRRRGSASPTTSSCACSRPARSARASTSAPRAGWARSTTDGTRSG